MVKILNKDKFRIGWELEYQSQSCNSNDVYFDDDAYNNAVA